MAHARGERRPGLPSVPLAFEISAGWSEVAVVSFYFFLLRLCIASPSKYLKFNPVSTKTIY